MCRSGQTAENTLLSGSGFRVRITSKGAFPRWGGGGTLSRVPIRRIIVIWDWGFLIHGNHHYRSYIIAVW